MVIQKNGSLYFTLTQIMGSFSCLPLNFYFESLYNLPKVPEYVEMQYHMMMSLKLSLTKH